MFAMALTLNEQIASPAVAILGTWDPFLEVHERLLRGLCSYAREQRLASVGIMLDPPPPVFVHGAAKWPVYSDAATRVKLLRESGLDAVAHIAFSAADLERTAADFFDLVCARVPIAEFWLRAQQTIGSGPAGNALAILVQCKRRTIRLRRLPPSDAGAESALVRQHLLTGELREAARIVGRPPTVTRPCAGAVRLAWPGGRYQALASREPNGRSGPGGGRASMPIEVTLVARENGLSTLAWPDPAIEALAFVAGPSESVSEGRAAARAAGA
jgi:hypothetical protein